MMLRRSSFAAAVLSIAFTIGCVAQVDAAEARPRNYPFDWWAELSQRADAWYATDESRAIAANILSWQDTTSGGWPLMVTIREPWTGDEQAVGPWGRRGALIKATANEIRFLSRAHRVTKDAQYAQAASAGFDFILKAQYPVGGWPHSYPNFRNPYDRYATLNDDELTDLLRLVRDVAREQDFAWMPETKRQAAQAAFDRGIDFILRTQIVSDGKPTVWAQQYDENTLEPKAARAFEPVALSGGESAGVLLLLMSIEQPNAAIRRAVEAGAQWYEKSKLIGIRVVRTSDDRAVVADTNAPPLWARFYDIDTNLPIFAGRDGVIKYRLADIEQERRAGYNWYDTWGDEVLTRYASWRREHARHSK